MQCSSGVSQKQSRRRESSPSTHWPHLFWCSWLFWCSRSYKYTYLLYRWKGAVAPAHVFHQTERKSWRLPGWQVAPWYLWVPVAQSIFCQQCRAWQTLDFAVQRTGCCTKFLVRLSTIPHEVCLSAYSVGGGRQSLLVCQIHCLDDLYLLSFTPFLMYWGSFHQLCVFLFFSVYFNQTVDFNQKESFNVHLIP